MKKTVFSGILLMLLVLAPASAQQCGTTKMTVYRAPDNSYSFLYPQGWKVAAGQDKISMMEDPSDPAGPGIDFLLGSANQPINSIGLIQVISGEIQKTSPDFNVVETLNVSADPDISGFTFTYSLNNMQIAGFGVSMIRQNAYCLSTIYGSEAGLSRYKPVHLLLYVVGSMTQGPTPNIPSPAQQAPPGAKQAVSGQKSSSRSQANSEYNRKFMKAATGAHMWNMSPYLFPNAFNPLRPLWR